VCQRRSWNNVTGTQQVVYNGSIDRLVLSAAGD